MKKNHSNRIVRAAHRKTRPGKTTRVAAWGMALSVAMAPSAAPALQADQLRLASQTPTAAAMLPMESVYVGLQGGSGSIAWDWLDMSSAAPGIALVAPGLPEAAMPGTPAEQSIWNRTLGAEAANRINGTQIAAQRMLPGKIQLIHPVTSRHFTSRFGWRKNPTGAGYQQHIGQDYAISCGSPVYAAADGIVIVSAWAGHSGMRVTVDHGNSVRTGYSHNSKLIANVGDSVKQGQVIALSGTTGNSTGCHVHFEVIINGSWQDPRLYLPGSNGQPGLAINAGQGPTDPFREAANLPPVTPPGNDLEIELAAEKKSKAPAKKPQAPHSDPIPTAKERPKPSPKPTTKPAPAPSPKPSPKPTTKPSPEPTIKPVPKPTVEPTPKPVPKPSVEPAPKPSPKPTTEPTPKPSPEPTTTPSPEPAPKPAPAPAEQPKPEPPVVAPEPKPVPESPKPTPAKTEPAPKPAPADGPLVCDPANVPAGTVVTAATIGELPCFDINGKPIPGVTGVYTPAAREQLG
jgi:murein DD-endopeptidase MepM/ murein hydrolase activator NlpD